MAEYLTIPEITEYEEIRAVSIDSDGVTFHVAIAVGEVALRLQRAFADGERLPLVVVATNASILALDSVYVTALNFTHHGYDPVAEIALLAGAVRVA